MTCYRRRGTDHRLIRDHHADDCPRSEASASWHPPLTWITCPGCLPCLEPHCQVCTREHLTRDHPQTCPTCVGAVRGNLARIIDLAALAEARLADWWPPASPGGGFDAAGNEPPLPGGDLLSLLGPGSLARDNPRRELDERFGDPASLAAELAFYEDDWRAERHPDQAIERTLQPRLPAVIAYLSEHLTWAAQQYGAFAEFAGVVRDLLALLEAELRDEAHIIRGVPCLACGATLTRHARRPRQCRHRKVPVRRTERDHLGYPVALGYYVERLEPWSEYDARVAAWFVDHLTCDQGGMPDEWRCARCRRVYSGQQYRNAVAAGARAFAPALPAADLVERFPGLKSGTVRQLANRGKVRRRGNDHNGRMLYDVDDVRRHVERTVFASRREGV